MSYPKRAKGWRTITVDEQRFRWCLRVGDSEGSTLMLQGSTSSGQQVIVTLRGWYDVWDFVGHFEKLPNNPPVITAKFAAQSIKFALANGWVPEHSGSPIALDYDNDSCILSQEIGASIHKTLIDTSNGVEAKFPVFREIFP